MVLISMPAYVNAGNRETARAERGAIACDAEGGPQPIFLIWHTALPYWASV